MVKASRRRRWGAIGVAAVATAVGGALAEGSGLPSGFLLAGASVGLAFALAAPGQLMISRGAFNLAQAVTGVALGSVVSASALGTLSAIWLPVLALTAATLGITIGSGVVFGRLAHIDSYTASLGMIAGGAAGIVAMAADLGADERVVGFLQYLRVLVVTIVTSLMAPLLFGSQESTSLREASLLGDPDGWALILVAVPLGVFVGRLVRLPAPALLGPLVFSMAVVLSASGLSLAVPPLLAYLAFAGIGLQIGVAFDVAALREVRRLALPAAGTNLAVLLVCAGLGVLLAMATGTSALDGYLATTPGGIFAVLPIVYGSDVNTTFVLAIQVLRMLIMILAAPLLVRCLHEWQGGASA